MAPDASEPGPKSFGFPERLAQTFNTAKISADHLDVASRSRVFVGNVFPNFSILVLPMTEDGTNFPPTAVLTVRVWQPASESKIEIWNWFFGYKNMTPEEKDRSYRAGLGTFTGPVGTFRQCTDIPKATRDLLAALKVDVPRKFHQLTTPGS